MNYKKIYSYTTVVVGSIFFSMIFFGMLISVIFFPKEVWFLIIPMFILLLSGWYAVGIGIIYPIYLSEKGVKYRGKKYIWADIRITAYPIIRRSPQYGYLLLFGKEYFQGEKIKKEIRSGFYVYLKEKPIIEILKYYDKKLLVLDENNILEGRLRSTRKINNIINEHNKNH